MMSRTATRHPSRTAAGSDVALLVMRIALVAIFPISAYYKLVRWPGIVGTVTQAGLPYPHELALLGTLMEAVLPLLIVIGLATRPAAVGLLVYVAAATYIGHPVWKVPAPEFFMQLMSFLKNVALAGGLVLLAVVGPGRIAIQPSPGLRTG